MFRVRRSATGLDEDNNPVAATDSTVPLIARGVAPGSTLATQEHARNGERIDFAVYFTAPVDITDEDELIVRGEQGKVRVQLWPAPSGSRVGTQVNVTVAHG